MADTVKTDYGMLDLLWAALRDHQKQHYMAKPKRFELHPALKPELIAEIHRKETYLTWSFMDALCPRDRFQTPTIFNVPVLWTTRAEVPCMVDCNENDQPL